MKQAELKKLIIEKLTEVKNIKIDGKMESVKLSRDEKNVFMLIQHTAFIHFTRLNGDSCARMTKQVLAYLKKYNI